jgi:DNA-binding XRE family transcriptional regulator
MVAAKRKPKKDDAPQPMLDLGWDEAPEETAEEAEAEPPVDDGAAVAAPDTEGEAENPIGEESAEESAEGGGDRATVPRQDGDPVVDGACPVEAESDPAEPVVDEEYLKIDDGEQRREEAPEEEPFEPETEAPPVSEAELPADPADTSVGGRLRNARLAAGLTVARVAEETCLRAQFIQALENGRYEDMLPLAFSRSYVRRLCELYCLPEGEIVKEFVAEYEKRHGPRQDASFFHVAPDGDDGASKVSYVPTGVIGDHKEGRSVTVGGVVAGLMVLIAVALSVTTVSTLVMRHLNARRAAVEGEAKAALEGDAEATVPEGKKGTSESSEALPPVDVRQFILPEELPLDELPIPK